MDQVKGQDHDQVANGDHFKVAVGTVGDLQRAPHTDEGNQQCDLGRKHRDIRDRLTQDGHQREDDGKATGTQTATGK